MPHLVNPGFSPCGMRTFADDRRGHPRQPDREIQSNRGRAQGGPGMKFFGIGGWWTRARRRVYRRRPKCLSARWPRDHGASGVVSAPAKRHPRATPELEDRRRRLRPPLARSRRRPQHRRLAARRTRAEDSRPGKVVKEGIKFVCGEKQTGKGTIPLLPLKNQIKELGSPGRTLAFPARHGARAGPGAGPLSLEILPKIHREV